MKNKTSYTAVIVISLVIVLLAALAGVASAATISSVDIKITEPATGEAVARATTTTSGVILSESWNPGVSGTFNADTEYTVNITVTASYGNTLSDSFSATVNGNSATVNGNVISYKFKATEPAKEVSSILLSLEIPKAANTPQKTPTIYSPNAGVKASVVWSPADSKFELGKKYAATVTIESTNTKAYPFADQVTVNLDGYPKNPTRDGNKLKVVHQFEETKPKGITKYVALTITAPTVGKTPDKKIIYNSQADKTHANVDWDTTSTFKPDTFYTATITLTAKDGYVIDKDLNATINGEFTYPIWESNQKATISYTFGQIASVDSVDVSFPAPKMGEKPAKTATSVVSKPVSANSAIIKWTPEMMADGTFDVGVEYTAEITIPLSNSNVVFDGDTIVKINGELVTSDVKCSVDSKKLIVTYTFPKTEQPLPLSLSLKKGWNFISTPKYLDSSCDTAGELFRDLNTQTSPMGYNPTIENGWYTLNKSTVIEPLNGYWIYSEEPITIALKYLNDARRTPPVKTVYKGWNAVGICAEKSMTAKSAFANLNWARYLPWDVKNSRWSGVIINGGSLEDSEENRVHLGNGGWLYVEADGTYLGSAT